MAAEAVKKAQDEGREWNYDYAVYHGVVNLKEQLLNAVVGSRIGLIYPPIPESPQSMLYTYEKGLNNTVLVKGTAVPLNLTGGNKLYGYLTGEEMVVDSNYLVATPFQIIKTHEEMVTKAINLCFSHGYLTEADLSNKFSLNDIASVYYEQISEAADFLTDCVQHEYNGKALTQESLERLELAFSFARRAILVARKHKDEESGDIITQEALRGMYWEHVRGFISDDEADDYNYRMEQMFGSITYLADAATGCPGAGLVGLGVQTSGIQGGLTLHSHETCPQKKCRRCGNTDIAETDTKCRKCDWKPGEPVEVKKSTLSEKTKIHAQEQVKNEKLKEIQARKKDKKKNNSWIAILFGIAQ